MAISYNKLWKLLIDKGLKRMQLRDMIGMSNSTLAKLGKNEPVALTVLEKICAALDCNFSDIIEYIPEQDLTRQK